MPGHDVTIECQYLSLQSQQLAAESGNASARYLGEPIVIGVGDDFEQLLDAPAPHRCDDPKLSKMGTNGIDGGGLLADEEMPCAMERQTALLLWGLGWHEPHIGSRDSFANRFRIGAIVLLSLDIRFHIGKAASGAPCGRALEFRATSDVTKHRPQSQPGTAAASERTPTHSGASIAGGEPHYHPHRRHEPEKPTSRYPDRSW